MLIYKIIYYTSVFVWLLPPLKQFRGRFFYFFLTLALSDPVFRLLFRDHIPPQFFYCITDIILIYAVVSVEKFLKYLLYSTPVFITLLVLAWNVGLPNLSIFLIIIDLVLLYQIFKLTIENTLRTNQINLFYILIIMYESSIVLKFVYSMLVPKTGMYAFVLSSAFEILLGICFCFIREDDLRLGIRFNS